MSNLRCKQIFKLSYLMDPPNTFHRFAFCSTSSLRIAVVSLWMRLCLSVRMPRVRFWYFLPVQSCSASPKDHNEWGSSAVLSEWLCPHKVQHKAFRFRVPSRVFGVTIYWEPQSQLQNFVVNLHEERLLWYILILGKRIQPFHKKHTLLAIV